MKTEELLRLLTMAETSNRTGFTLPEWWGPRVREILGEPETPAAMNCTQAFEAWWCPQWGNLGAKRPNEGESFHAGWNAARASHETSGVVRCECGKIKTIDPEAWCRGECSAPKANAGTKIPHTPEELAVLQRFAVEALAPEDWPPSKTNERPAFNHERDCGLTNDAGTCECPQPSSARATWPCPICKHENPVGLLDCQRMIDHALLPIPRPAAQDGALADWNTEMDRWEREGGERPNDPR